MIPDRTDSSPLQLKIFRIAISIALVLFICLILFLNGLIAQEKKLSDRIYPNVYLDGMNIGGKTKEEAKALFHNANDSLKHIIVTTLYKDSPVATFSASDINLRLNTDDMVERAYLVSRTPRTSSRVYQKVATLFYLQKFEFTSQIDYDRQPFIDLIGNLEDQFNKPAKNALFTFDNGKVSSFRPDEKGNRINRDSFLKKTEEAISQLKNNIVNPSIMVTDSVVEPEVSLHNSNSFGIEELIGVGKSDFTHSIPERVYNITVATSHFHGVLIPQGQTFSFDDIIGDISAQTGYKPAYVIKNGRTVLGDGGGVCQVSTTFFRAALNAGLHIIERNAHAYRVGYYENDSPPGFDATIFAPSVDLRVKNDTPAAILIQTEIDSSKNLLYFRLYGKKDGRSTEISQVTLTDQQPPPPPLYQDDFTLKKGITRQVDFPAWGGKASFKYSVHKAGEEIVNQTFVSVFRPWRAVYLVGQAD